MGWLYVPGLAASNWESISQCPTFGASVRWRGKPSPQRSWSRRWSKAHWLRSLSGMTLEPSTAARGVESWISSLRDSPASRSASPADSAVKTTNATSGPTSSGSSMKCAPPWCSSRTSQTSFSFFDPSERNYHEWVTGLSLEYSARRKSGRPMGESGSFAWPAATSQDYKRRGPRSDQQGLNSNVTSEWQTPHGIANTDRFGKTAGGGGEFAKQATEWSTPHAHNGQGSPGAGHLENGERHRDLVVESTSWATPTSRDHKDGACAEANVPTNALLGRQVLRVPTGDGSSNDGPISPRLWTTPCQDDTGSRAGKYAQGGTALSAQTKRGKKRLNVLFVSWLMGIPPGWIESTSFGPAEMQSYLSRQRGLLQLLQRD